MIVLDRKMDDVDKRVVVMVGQDIASQVCMPSLLIPARVANLTTDWSDGSCANQR